MVEAEDLETLLKKKEIALTDVFPILQSLCAMASRSQGKCDETTRSLILRVLDRKNHFECFHAIVNALIAHAGLYPYLDPSGLTAKDAVIRELHRPEILNQNGDFDAEMLGQREEMVFHQKQANVFYQLLAGENIILSAPTSFGKSALIEPLIDAKNYTNCMIIVPSIALIDETRRRLSRFKKNYKIITHPTQTLHSHNIFVLTQERAIDFPNLPAIDLLVLDEFYNLDPGTESDSERAMTLNHAFYQLKKKSRQFYLLGPNIEDIPDGFTQKFECQFIKTDFATVVTETILVRPKGEEGIKKKRDYKKELVALCQTIKGSTLIYCDSPKQARDIVSLLSNALGQVSEGLADAADWIGENFHPKWTLVNGLKKGIGLHHGRMPRSLAQLCVKGFNNEKLAFLVCTSSLIEGVNTTAKNVIIFKNTLAGKLLDFFTFNNISGRSGRMFKHFIGNVYVFHDIPKQVDRSVDIPLFTQDENATDSLIIQIDERDLNDHARERHHSYHQQNTLPIDVIRLNAGVAPDDQIAFARYLRAHSEDIEKLIWIGRPSYEQLELLCKNIFIFFVKKNSDQVCSGPQLRFKMNRLELGSIKEIVLETLNRDKKINSADDAVESVLHFIRQWPEYHFPRFAMAICRIVNAIAAEMNITDKNADYSHYCCLVENLFSDAPLSALDEYGLPFPFAQNLANQLDFTPSLDATLKKLSACSSQTLTLTPFEKTLLDDVKQSI